MLRRGQDRLKGWLPGGLGGRRGLIFIALAALALWLASGFYRVDANEQGVAMIFGKWVATTGPGLNYNLPAPIGSVETPMVDFENRVEIGFRSAADGTSTRDISAESLMLTGDENIIDIQFVVLWKIGDAGKYLFSVRDPDETVKAVSEAAMREIIGQSDFESTRTKGRAEVESRTQELIQHVLDGYNAGIVITSLQLLKVDPPDAVIEAFRDVQAARADKERSVNEAQAYYNEITQRAEGQAQQVIKAGEAYKAEKIAIATGDAQRFLSVYSEFAKNKELTERRIYLETMESVMHNMNKVLVDGAPGTGGALPYLSLNELLKLQSRSAATNPPPSDSNATAAPATTGASQ
ncbi:protease modulator HflK [Hypericibacter adhaerens]|jgi:membrane protease subunit HflK|uniref:Protein HflK n=1 Tax=Hypericibacter adhaerens TaxID=2602016 RepID=A0A5J6MUF5_9PROT|nr:protease modulator HflK [Hypericibacter adhaerens]